MRGFLEVGYRWTKIKNLSPLLSERSPINVRSRYRVIERMAGSSKAYRMKRSGWDLECENLLPAILQRWKEWREIDRVEISSSTSSSTTSSSPSSKKTKPNTSIPSQHKKADKIYLEFPVHRIAEHMRRQKIASRLKGGAPVYMAAVLQYVARILVENAGDIANDSSQANSINENVTSEAKVIVPRHIVKAVENNDTLNALMHNVRQASLVDSSQDEELSSSQVQDHEEHVSTSIMK